MIITLNIFENIFAAIGGAYPTAKVIYAAIGTVLSVMLAYKTVYKIIGLFFTRKFKPAKQNHKYAILIAARNEQSVIGNLWTVLQSKTTQRNF